MFWVYLLFNKESQRTYVGVTRHLFARYCGHYLFNKYELGKDMRELGFEFRIVPTKDEAYCLES
jgi:predicted GIY-YIG superfamily endonuclease